ncbi:MAG: GNAT family N-acetyltransferase [Polyangiales bacterium]
MIEIELSTAPTDDVRVLVSELEEVLSAEYPPEQRHGLKLEAIFQPRVRFFVARLDGVAMGCGGVALFEDHGEVKRMYVRSEARGRGLAPALMERNEAETRAAGLTILRLETGTKQLAAMRFYERWGFRERDAFGAYATMPETAIATSVFYEKALAQSVEASVGHMPSDR